MTASLLFRQANEALQAGDKATARRLLQQAVRQEPQNYKSWLWLASVTPSPAASLEYITRAEALRSQDPVVRKARLWAEKRLEKEEPAKPVTASLAPKTGFRPWIWTLLILVCAAGALIWWQAGFQGTTNPGSVVDNMIPAPAGDGPAELNAGTGDLVSVVSSPSDTPEPPTRRPTATATPQPHVPAKQIVHSQAAPLPTWTITPTPSPTPTPTPTAVPTFLSGSNPAPVGRPLGVGPQERWIDVDLSQQTLNAYEGDTLVYSTYISSGTWDHPTVTGQFRIWLRFESQTMDGTRLGYDYYLENVPYVMYFYQDYALHGTFWHNNFGTPMSHGCVNMETGDAGWLFSWSTIGTVVNVHY